MPNVKRYREPIVIDFVVEGTGKFPLDMLRYDGAWPRTADDAVAIEHSFETGGSALARTRIRLQTARPRLTDARWASFGWHLVEVDP